MLDSAKEQRTTKEDLIKRLQAAAELEHQFTCMYLFAAFSLKKHPDVEGFNEADVEITRRWASVIYMIARQEMEHLAIVNQLLAAIGEPPCFHRRNIPYHPEFFMQLEDMDKGVAMPSEEDEETYFEEKTKEALKHLANFYKDEVPKNIQEMVKEYVEKGELELAGPISENVVASNNLVPSDIPFLFTPFDLTASRRYTVMESPFAAHLILSGQIDIAADLIKWGYKVNDDKHNFDCIIPSYWNLKPGRGGEDIKPGDIEEYYDKIKADFVELGDSIFVPPNAERQVEILSQYDIYIFPITDLASAKNGIELIVKQGEAVGSSPGFDSHFRHFYDITSMYEKKLNVQSSNVPPLKRITENCKEYISYRDFKPFFDILHNPTRKQIKNKYARKVFDLFNYGYKTMCFCLNGLYGWYSERADYPFLSQSLRDIIFAPTMTLFIRAIGEILVLLPSETLANEINPKLKGAAGKKMLRAAPNFNMEDPENSLELEHKYNFGKKGFRSLEIDGKANKGDWQHAKKYAFYLDLKFYTNRLDKAILELKKLSHDEIWLNELEAAPFEGNKESRKEQADYVKKCMVFAHQNMFRMTANLKRSYDDNIYKKFDPFTEE